MEPLRWLFVAEFDDGNSIEQTYEDKSLTRTDGTGSAFTDVLEYEKTSRLKAFHLASTDDKQIATVDLTTGAFIVNNTPFHAHDQNFDPTKYELRLIYFRETRYDNISTNTVQGDGSVKNEHVGQRHYVNRYFIGWQTTVNGKNKQATIAVG